MKRIILTTILAFFAMALFAKSPRHAVEKYFDGRYNRNPNVETTIIKSDNGYFRSLSIAPTEKAIIEEVTKAFEQDKKISSSVCDTWSGGKHDIILGFFFNGQPVSMGFESAPGKKTEVFISGHPDAYK